MNEQFPKSRVLRRRDDFDELYQRGRRLTGNSVVLSYKHSSDPRFRVGVTCGRSVGNAVIRNRWKRRIREIVRRTPDLWMGFDVLIIVRRGIAARTFTQLRDELESLARGMQK